MRPLLLDLFCGAGGAAMGYHQAGFDVVGVDNLAQPDYPFPFIQADALQAPVDLAAFDAIHASPPCQAYSSATPALARANHSDLVDPTRRLLEETELPYVIENVPGSPVRPDVTLCGSMFGLPIRRHRLFELGRWFMMQHGCSGHDGNRPYTISGNLSHSKDQNYQHSRKPSTATAALILGIQTTSVRSLTNAIPTAYTEHIGRQLIAHLDMISTKGTDE